MIGKIFPGESPPRASFRVQYGIKLYGRDHRESRRLQVPSIDGEEERCEDSVRQSASTQLF